MADTLATLGSLNANSTDFYNKALSEVLSSGRVSDANNDAAGGKSFSAMLNQAMGLVSETDHYAAKAEEAAIDFALGNTESTHEMAIAQQKAYVSLQYTVAVKNALLDAYKEIMQIQI